MTNDLDFEGIYSRCLKLNLFHRIDSELWRKQGQSTHRQILSERSRHFVCCSFPMRLCYLNHYSHSFICAKTRDRCFSENLAFRDIHFSRSCLAACSWSWTYNFMAFRFWPSWRYLLAVCVLVGSFSPRDFDCDNPIKILTDLTAIWTKISHWIVIETI